MLYRKSYLPRRAGRASGFNAGLLLRASCLSLLLLLLFASAGVCRAQTFAKEVDASAQGEIVIRNAHGRVTVAATGDERKTVALKAESPGAAVGERDVMVKREGDTLTIEVLATRAGRDRVDLSLEVPARIKLRVETEDGAVDVSGAPRVVEAATDTGTIRVDVPLDSLSYSFQWTASRPRFFSAVELGKVREGRGGRFAITGRFGDKKAAKDQRVRLDLTTARGVVLFGVEAAMVPGDLRERQLTEAARAIIRSGNEDLIEAVRRVAPRFVGEYTGTLPPPRVGAPTLSARTRGEDAAAQIAPSVMRLNASVTDEHGRAIGGLKADDFAVFENGQPRTVTEVQPAHTPFNLVLLLDVSGSVDERLDFIRKAALDFVNTVNARDRIAIISFRDDVQLVSDFTTDHRLLAERIKDIEAGGATALYDALAYTLVNTLRPLRGERTAVVILSDGDDNRSFVPFASVLEATIESGALVYPLYIPSGLIPSRAAPAPETTLDPMRTRYLTLTSRAAEEARQLAQASGGIYYPLTRFDELQRAYDDIVTQLRTAYTITYAANAAPTTITNADHRIRVRLTRRADATIRLSPSVTTDKN